MEDNGYIIGPIKGNKKKPYSFVIGVLSVLLFAFGHISGSNGVLYLGCVAMAINFVVFSDELLCLELLYIPLVNILKLSPDGVSLFSYISLMGLIAFVVKRKTVTINATFFFVCVGLLLLFLAKEIFQQFGVTMVYIRLLLTMVTTAIFVKIKTAEPDTTAGEMRRANLFLTWGVILASIIGFFFADSTRLSQFLTVDSNYIEGELASRFCGVSSDPNYYSSLVIFAISTNLFHFIHHPRISHLIFTIVLVIFGILSLSKMYLLLLAVVFALFLLAWIREKGIASAKGFISVVIITTFVLVGGYYMINSPTVQLILARMGESSSVNDFTTGRLDTWLGYISAMLDSVEYLLIGVGNNAAIAGRHNTHNTILQIWWKLGALGVLLIFIGFVSIWHNCKRRNARGTFLILTGCFGATLALDMLFFEQFFWFFAFCVLCKHMSDSKIETTKR